MKYYLLVLLIFVSSCASVAPHRLMEADESIMFNNNCRFIAQIEGHGSQWLIGRKSQIAGAKNEAIQSAVEIKATHVIWGQPQLLPEGVYITGRAYNCTGQ